jgi:hypothetical protein
MGCHQWCKAIDIGVLAIAYVSATVLFDLANHNSGGVSVSTGPVQGEFDGQI